MELNMKELLEAGAHFGHQTHRWNPKMAPFIYASRNGVHIINLSTTIEKMDEAKAFIYETIGAGGKIMFVGTKKQAQEIITEEAKRCSMPYVSERWLGGMVTNFSTIIRRTTYMKQLRAQLESPTEKMIKKERVKAQGELEKLEKVLGGIADLDSLPSAIFVVDIIKESTAVKEAQKAGIPIIAIVDSNTNPENVTYPIPSNDDAVKTIKLITSFIADVILDTDYKKKVEEKEEKTKTKEEIKVEKPAKVKKEAVKEAKADKKTEKPVKKPASEKDNNKKEV